jgi:hypothetical protein
MFAFVLLFLSILVAFIALPSKAAPPLLSVDGTGGGAISPMAYVINPITEERGGLLGSNWIGKPKVGVYVLGAPTADIMLYVPGFAMSFFNRVEIGYSYVYADLEFSPEVHNIALQSMTAKVQILKDGEFGWKWTPAFAVGAVHKHTNFNVPSGVNAYDSDQGTDFYFALTKRFPDLLPLPILVNAGVRWTKGYILGVNGYGQDYDHSAFVGIAVRLSRRWGIGYSYIQGTHVGDNMLGAIRTDEFQEWNLIYSPTEKIDLVASYGKVGHENIHERERGGKNPSGLGDAWILTMQYGF